ncbi:RNA polymerase sigma factor [Hyphococcus sp.]|uniref:RNA polymerase sigma factor n=1 Tax=Hyphococcus sp. TaxID=2038636 RepID=UPI003CCC1841
MNDARAIAEQTARASYGKLLAWLCSRTSDVAGAEDALADAFRAALEHWPDNGVPHAPEAWILTTARRKLIDQSRKNKTRADAASTLLLAAEEAQDALQNEVVFPDERLKLMLACAHPAIDASIHTPLMLQTVLGLDAARIASAFLISPKAMSARLVRAKRKIKAANIPFAEPSIDTLPLRINALLEAIYAAYGTGWNDDDGADENSRGLTFEAIFLAKLVSDLSPDAAEAWGLLSLMLHAEARRAARRRDGIYVPLREQDTNLWDKQLIQKAERALSHAWRLNQPGRYQIEAAIQSAHAASKLSGRDVSDDIIVLYQRLIEIAPSIGAQVSYAAALSSGGQHDEALLVLDSIAANLIDSYQPYWAIRAHVLNALNRHAGAQSAYDRAIGLASDPAVRTFLFEKKQMVGKAS